VLLSDGELRPAGRVHRRRPENRGSTVVDLHVRKARERIDRQLVAPDAMVSVRLEGPIRGAEVVLAEEERRVGRALGRLLEVRSDGGPGEVASHEHDRGKEADGQTGKPLP